MLASGTKLGTFQITSHIGSGGMGDVYQAHDSKLDRDVAIKVLPEQFARDSERLAGFQREAKLLAALNHPNIAAIYGLEQSGNTHYLVMELVPGETLRERTLGERPVPVEEALTIAKQIAEALEAAHNSEKVIIHRDLKPANLKITPEGRVKNRRSPRSRAQQRENHHSPRPETRQRKSHPRRPRESSRLRPGQSFRERHRHRQP